MKRFEFKVTEDGRGLHFECVNDGFNVYELLGFVDVERQSLLEQNYHRENFTRTCIKPDGTIMKIEDKERNDG